MIERNAGTRFYGTPKIPVRISADIAKDGYDSIELDVAFRMTANQSQYPAFLPIVIFLVFTPKYHSSVAQFVHLTCRNSPDMKRLISSYISKTPTGEERYFKAPERTSVSMFGIWNFGFEIQANRAIMVASDAVTEVVLQSYLWNIDLQAPASISFVILSRTLLPRYTSILDDPETHGIVPSVTSNNINKYWSRFGFKRTVRNRNSTLAVFGNRYDVSLISNTGDSSTRSARYIIARAINNGGNNNVPEAQDVDD